MNVQTEPSPAARSCHNPAKIGMTGAAPIPTAEPERHEETLMRLQIRPMKPEEIDLALDWAAAEGWNPGLHDAVPFHAADPEGFLIGWIDTTPVAIISAVRYVESFGFIGFYIVHPDWRGQGHGWAIWQAAMARLAGRTIGLDGVPAQQDNYRRSGFELAYRQVRYQGHGLARGVPADPELVDLRQVPPADLAAGDRAGFPTAREAFLHAWIRQPRTRALGLLDQGRLIGYGVRRACRQGFKIGPLLAETPAGAERLFTALRADVAREEPMFLDIPACHPAAVALVERHGWQPVFETARMYAGPAPTLDLARIYGVTSFELG